MFWYWYSRLFDVFLSRGASHSISDRLFLIDFFFQFSIAAHVLYFVLRCSNYSRIPYSLWIFSSFLLFLISSWLSLAQVRMLYCPLLWHIRCSFFIITISKMSSFPFWRCVASVGDSICTSLFATYFSFLFLSVSWFYSSFLYVCMSYQSLLRLSFFFSLHDFVPFFCFDFVCWWAV